MESTDHILSKMREPSCFKGKVPVERVNADFREFADRLEAAIKREREAVGNSAKMREALETISKCDINKEEDCITLYRECFAALAEPPRNCDVGTPEEQTKRFQKFCSAHNDCYKCDCPCDNNDGVCQLRWAQMPYECSASERVKRIKQLKEKVR